MIRRRTLAFASLAGCGASLTLHVYIWLFPQPELRSLALTLALNGLFVGWSLLVNAALDLKQPKDALQSLRLIGSLPGLLQMSVWVAIFASFGEAPSERVCTMLHGFSFAWVCFFYVDAALLFRGKTVAPSYLAPNPSVKGTPRKRAAPYVERWASRNRLAIGLGVVAADLNSVSPRLTPSAVWPRGREASCYLVANWSARS